MRRAIESHMAATDVDPDQIDTSDLMQSISTVEEATAAVERFYSDLNRLEQVKNALESTHASQFTPGMALAVEAHYIDHLDKSFGLEAFSKGAEDDIIDVSEKSSASGMFDKAKTGVSEAAKKAAALVKAGFKYLMELIDQVISFVFETRKSIVSYLEKAKNNPKRPSSADVRYNRFLKPLTFGDAFDANSVSSVQKVCSELVLASSLVLENTVNIVEKTGKLQYDPSKLADMAKHFKKVFNAAGFKEYSDGWYDIAESIGGRKISVNAIGHYEVETITSAYVVEVQSKDSTFNRKEIDQAIKGALGIMEVVARYEPKMKNTKAICNSFLTADVVSLAFAGKRYNFLNYTGASFHSMMSGYINIGLKLAITTAVKTASATARLVKAYDNSEESAKDAGAEPDLSGVDFPRLSA